MSEITSFVIEQVGSFEGSYPEIATRPDFQLDERDIDPVFMTLPLGKAGNKSRNDRTYSESFYKKLVRLVNERTKPVRGIKGHPDPKRIAYETHLPVIEWVGATIDDNGMVWGKAYVYSEQSEIRANVKRAKMRALEVATSLRGNGLVDENTGEFIDIDDLWIDFVEPEYAGVENAVASPIVTQEKQETDGGASSNPIQDTTETIEDNIMADEKLNADVIQLQEKINSLETYKAQFSAISELLGSTEVTKAIRELLRRNTELEPIAEAYAGVKDELGGTNDIVEAIQELKSDRDGWRKQATGFTAKAIVDAKVTFAGARPMIAEMIGLNYETPQESRLLFIDAAKLAEQVDGLLEKSFVQETIKAQVLAANGGRAFVGTQGEFISELDESPEAMATARGKWGF